LSSSVPVAYIDIRVLAHATEDREKALASVRNLLPLEFCDEIVFRRSDLKGHHGNPITLLEARVKGNEHTREVLTKLVAGLSIMDKEQLGREIDLFMEDGNLYLRFDKQSAYLGELKLCSGDSVHFKLHFSKSSKDDVVEFCRRFGVIL